MSRSKGLFLVIEGLDGSGSSTQIKILADKIIKTGRKVYITKEPTDNIIGGLIRGVLSGVYKLSDEGFQLLFSADRSHHLERVIEPMLKEDCVVICDRYLWSTVAFGAVNIDRDWLVSMQKYFRKPDFSVFLQVDPKVCIKRIKDNRFNFELFEEEKRLAKVWENYVWLNNNNSEITQIVDGNGSIEDVSNNLWSVIKPLLK